AAFWEARTGFEPACDGFANRCLTTWLPRPENSTETVPRGQPRARPAGAVRPAERAGTLPCADARIKRMNSALLCSAPRAPRPAGDHRRAAPEWRPLHPSSRPDTGIPGP